MKFPEASRATRVSAVFALVPISPADHDTSPAPFTLLPVLPIVIVRAVPQLAVVISVEPLNDVPLIRRPVCKVVAVSALPVTLPARLPRKFVAFTLPATSNFSEGVFVPTPIRPFAPLIVKREFAVLSVSYRKTSFLSPAPQLPIVGVILQRFVPVALPVLFNISEGVEELPIPTSPPSAVILLAAKLPDASRATTLPAVFNGVASTDHVAGAEPSKLSPVK